MRLHTFMLLDPGPDPTPGPPIIGGHGGVEGAGAPACRRCGRALGYHADDLSSLCAACDACDACDDD